MIRESNDKNSWLIGTQTILKVHCSVKYKIFNFHKFMNLLFNFYYFDVLFKMKFLKISKFLGIQDSIIRSTKRTTAC